MHQRKAEPDPVDVAVGARVRLLRKSRDISQERLAAAIGVTFQQVQKYERAANRISISMLARIAHALGTTVTELVDERPTDQRPFEDIMGLLGQPGTLELLRAFAGVSRTEQRRALIDVTRAVADLD